MSTTRNDVDPIREEPQEAPPPPGDRVFERYALVASLTLLILCLVWMDRRTEAEAASAAPPADHRLRIEIGGGAHAGFDDGRRTEPWSADHEDPAAGADPQIDPDPLPRDDPPVAPTPPPRPDPEPEPRDRTYVVQKGDTLTGISRTELGSTARWKELQKLNGIADPDDIRIGDVLKLPTR